MGAFVLYLFRTKTQGGSAKNFSDFYYKSENFLKQHFGRVKIKANCQAKGVYS